MPCISRMEGAEDALATMFMPLYRIDELGGSKRMGVVATRNIIRGARIFSEEVMVTRHTIESSRGDVVLYNRNLGLALGSVQEISFGRRFWQLPHGPILEFGPVGAFFERGCIPGYIGDTKVRFMGIDSSFLNHGCVANAETSIVPKFVDGKLVFVLHVYACDNIQAGDEITVPYKRVCAEIPQRRRLLRRWFGFNCECTHCVTSDFNVERGMLLGMEKIPKLTSVWHTARDPAGILQIGYSMMTSHFRAKILDNRYPEIYERCAMTCGYHSDVGRALEFLERARLVYLANGGRNGTDTKRIVRYLSNPTQLPCFGASTRGLSTAADMLIIRENPGRDGEILFMVGLKAGQYLKLSDVPRYLELKKRYKEQKEAERMQAQKDEQVRAQRAATKIEDVQETKNDDGKVATTPGDLDKAVKELRLQDDEIVRQEQENHANGRIGKEVGN